MHRRSAQFAAWLAAAALLTVNAGCLSHLTRITSARDAVPASLLPHELLAEPHGGDAPIPFSLLAQPASPNYVIGIGDTLGIFINQVVPGKDDSELPQYTNSLRTREPYPVTGVVHSPIVGVPMTVGRDGTILFPAVGKISLVGLSPEQAARTIYQAYAVDRSIVRPESGQVYVQLVKKAVHRVLVIREDVGGNRPTFYYRKTVPATKRGASYVLDLPSRENDVLHALLATGGLPGIDCRSELWVLRSRVENFQSVGTSLEELRQTGPNSHISSIGGGVIRTSIRIPLRLPLGAPAPFGPDEIILHEGDIVYLQSRDDEVFYTGGLLPGGIFPLPRDHDLTLIEAMSMSTASAGGPAGYGAPTGLNGRDQNFRGGGHGGVINPTRVLVIRRLPSGDQVKISVDLNREVNDVGKQLIIRPDDFIMLQFKPSEFAGNLALGMLRFNILETIPSVTGQGGAVSNANNGAGGQSGGSGGTPPGGGETGAGTGT